MYHVYAKHSGFYTPCIDWELTHMCWDTCDDMEAARKTVDYINRVHNDPTEVFLVC